MASGKTMAIDPASRQLSWQRLISIRIASWDRSRPLPGTSKLLLDPTSPINNSFTGFSVGWRPSAMQPAAIITPDPCVSDNCGRIAGEHGPPSITIVLHDFASGGTEHVAIRMANEWVLGGRHVTIFCGTEDGPLRTIVAPSVRVVRAPRECRRSPLSRITLANALAAFALSERPAIVYAPGNFHLAVLARFRAIDRSGAITIGKLSNPVASHLKRGPLRSLYTVLQQRVFSGIDCLIAMSPALRVEAAIALGDRQIAHAWEPVLHDVASPRFTRRTHSHPKFIAIGRLERQKHFALAIQALALSSALPRASLMIVGEGSQRLALERLANKLGVGDRVSFRGYCPNAASQLSGATGLLLPSRFEGYPAVAVEAIAAGVPVLATQCSPAIGEILCHDARSQIVAAQPQAFAAAMDAIVSQAAPVSVAADFLRARHNIAGAARQYLELLDRVWLAGRASR